MRIGIDVRCLMDGGKTGVEEYTTNVIFEMIKQNPSDIFVLFANSRKKMQLPKIEAHNVEWCVYAYSNKLFNASLKLLRWPKIDRLTKADVLFIPSVRLVPCSENFPIVTTFHDLSFVRHPEYFSWKRRIWHWLMEPKKLARRATYNITVSETTARDLCALYEIEKEKVVTIYSGVGKNFAPVNRDSEKANMVRDRYGLPEKFILFLGTIEPRKNIDGLIASYEHVRRMGYEHKLVLAGIRGWVKKEFFENIKKKEFAKDIIFTGYVDDSDKAVLYSLADLFVYPSFYEGFGFPPLEALLCGTPVITSYNSSMPEVAGMWARLVNPYDPNELADVMLEILKKNVRVDMKVVEEIRQKYSWEKAARETMNVIREAVTKATLNPHLVKGGK